MGFEEELFHELATNTWNKRSRMQQEMVKGAKGEPFAVQELYRKGPLTPSQLASSMKTTTGRVSTLLSALEKKADHTRIRPRRSPCGAREPHRSRQGTRRTAARKHARGDLLDLLADGERRAREFVELTEEFTTYMSLCMPGKPRPTADEVKAAFSGNAQEDA